MVTAAADRSELEARVQALCRAGDANAAVTAAIHGYGAELLGFIAVMTPSHTDAADVFDDVCVRLWQTLSRFRWESSLRTWLYTITRRACAELYRVRHRQPAHVPLTAVDDIDAEIRRIRTVTLSSLSQRRDDQIARLRGQLSPEDQALLTLRVDRRLDWREIASILSDAEDDAPFEAAALTREAAALRKRFERIKARLRKLAEAEQAARP